MQQIKMKSGEIHKSGRIPCRQADVIQTINDIVEAHGANKEGDGRGFVIHLGIDKF
jgi:hypothetical protein